MPQPPILPLFDILKIQLKSDFERAVEHLRPFETPSRDMLAFKIFNLLSETERFYTGQNIPHNTVYSRVETGLAQMGWPSNTAGQIVPETREALTLLTFFASDERVFRQQLNFMRHEKPEATNYIMNHLRDISKARAAVSVEIVKEMAMTHNLRPAMPPRI